MTLLTVQHKISLIVGGWLDGKTVGINSEGPGFKSTMLLSVGN